NGFGVSEQPEAVISSRPRVTACVPKQRSDVQLVADRAPAPGAAVLAKLHQATGGSHPDGVVRLRKDGSYQGAGRERHDLLRRQAMEPEHRADPDVAVAVLEQ